MLNMTRDERVSGNTGKFVLSKEFFSIMRKARIHKENPEEGLSFPSLVVIIY